MPIQLKSLDDSLQADILRMGGYDMPNNVRRCFQTGSANSYYNKLIDAMPTGMVYTGATAVSSAIAASEEGDVVYIHAGDAVYEPLVVMAVAAARLKIIGQQSSGKTWGSPSLHVHGTDSKGMTINAHQVEVAFISFHSQTANISIDIGTTMAPWRTHIHDCYFGGNNTATVAIAFGYKDGGNHLASEDCPSTIIERCSIWDYVTYGIHSFASYSSGIFDCIFNIKASTTGIYHPATTAQRPYSIYRGNLFTTLDSTNAIGIDLANTPTVGAITMVGNEFNGFAGDSKCITKRTAGYIGRNWNNGTVIATA